MRLFSSLYFRVGGGPCGSTTKTTCCSEGHCSRSALAFSSVISLRWSTEASIPPTKKSNFWICTTGCSELLISRVMLSSSPSRMETMPISEATPIATPSMINPLLSLCASSTSTAIPRFSPIKPRRFRSLIAQCLDRVELGGLHGRISPEEHAHREGHAHADDNGPDLDGVRKGGKKCDEGGDEKASNDTQNAADTRECDRLHQELPQDVDASRSHSFAAAA